MKPAAVTFPARGRVLAFALMSTRLLSFMRLSVALIAAAGIAGCGQRNAGTGGEQPKREISGVLLLAPGQLVPAGMPLELELAELTSAEPPPAAIATARLESGDSPETPFSLQYDAAKVQSARQYVLRARAAIEGTVYLAGSALAPVAVQGTAFPVDVVLRKPAEAPPLYLDVSVLRLEHKREGDWSRALRALMPAIQACLRSVSGEGLAVTKAWPVGGGKIGVRIRAQDGSGFDCTALPDGSKFESLSGLPSFAEKLPGEGEPSFVPASGSPKMDKCLRYERVLGSLDETLGWLVYDTCPKDAPPAAPAARPST